MEAARKSTNNVIAVLGLAFKANIDDLRESPSLDIATEIAAKLPEKQVLVVEPNIQELPTGLANKENVKLSSAKEAIEAAEVITLLVDHDEFKSINPSLLTGKTIIDTKGLWA